MIPRHLPHHIHLFANLIPFFAHWGYIIIFIGTFFEGLPLIGYIAPGGVSVIVGGFLAREHVLNIVEVFLFAYLGALLGDLFAFLLGKLYGQKFLKNYGRYFFLKEHHIAKTENLLRNHTGKAIIVGRFSYITRSLSPFLAGASNIDFGKFFRYSLLSVLIWDVVHLAIGFVAGAGYVVAARYFNYILILAVILSIIIFYGYRFVNKRHQAFKQYHVYTLIINIISIYVFAEALQDIIDRGWLFHIDRAVNHFVPTIWNPIAIQIMIVISNLLTPLNVFLFSCMLIGYLLYKKDWYYATLSFLALTLGILSEYILKLLVERPRPSLALIPLSDFSFPSDHATLISIFAILLFHCLRKDFKSKLGKVSLFIVALVLMLLVGMSRIYLNVHWLSDIIGGYALGVFSVTFCILLLRAGKFVLPQLIKIGEVLLSPFFKDNK